MICLQGEEVQSPSLDGDEGPIPEGSVPWEKLAFASPGWPRDEIAAGLLLTCGRGAAAPPTAGPGYPVLPQSGAGSQPPPLLLRLAPPPVPSFPFSSPRPTPRPAPPSAPSTPPPQSREFPKHPKVCVSCLGEGASADIRGAEGLGKAQCSGASNPRASSSFLSPHPLCCNESPVQPRRPRPQPFQVAVRSARAAATDAAGAPRERWSSIDRAERAALRVFNPHTLDSSQNDLQSAGDRRRTAVPQSRSDSHLEEREGKLSEPRSPFGQENHPENFAQWKQEKLKERTVCWKNCPALQQNSSLELSGPNEEQK